MKQKCDGYTDDDLRGGSAEGLKFTMTAASGSVQLFSYSYIGFSARL